MVYRVSGKKRIFQGLHRGPPSIEVMKMMKHPMVIPDFSSRVPMRWEWSGVFEVRTEPSSSFLGLSGEVLERQEPTEPELTEPELMEPETTEVFHVGEAAEE